MNKQTPPTDEPVSLLVLSTAWTDGAQRVNSYSVQQYVHWAPALAQYPVLEDHLRACPTKWASIWGFDEESCFSILQSGHAKCARKQIVGLALVKKGCTAMDVLAPLALQEQFLHAFYGHPAGITFLRVLCAEPVSPAILAVPRSGREDLKLSRLAKSVEESVRWRCQKFLQKHGGGRPITKVPLLCFQMPTPLALAVSCGQWSTLAWYPTFRSDCALFPGFPARPKKGVEVPSTWPKPVMLAEQTGSLLSFEKLRSLANDLVQWAPRTVLKTSACQGAV